MITKLPVGGQHHILSFSTQTSLTKSSRGWADSSFHHYTTSADFSVAFKIPLALRLVILTESKLHSQKFHSSMHAYIAW